MIVCRFVSDCHNVFGYPNLLTQNRDTRSDGALLLQNIGKSVDTSHNDITIQVS